MTIPWQRTPEGRERLAEQARQQWRSGRGLGSAKASRKRREGVKRAAARKRKASPGTALVVHRPRPRSRVKTIHVDPIPQTDPLELLAHTVVGNIWATIDNIARSARVPSAVLAERVFGLLSVAVRR